MALLKELCIKQVATGNSLAKVLNPSEEVAYIYMSCKGILYE